MKRIKPLLFFLSLICYALLSAQELPPIENFTPSDYHAENQNWGIAQSDDKLIYIANNKGLLTYNGASWTLYPSPNQTIMRSVNVVSEKIYTGSYMEFGYWQADEYGELIYTSLTETLGLSLIEDEEFWKIIDIEKYLIFQSLDRIYIYDSERGTTRIIETKNSIIHSYKLDGSIYFQRIGEGIFKIENGRDVLVSGADILRNHEVVAMFSNANGFHVVTRDRGIFRMNKEDELLPWDGPLNDRLKSLSIYSAQQLRNKNLVFGSIANGLILATADGNEYFELNQDNGLVNNTVLAISEDQDQNIWLALDNGLSFINSTSSFKIYVDKDGSLGSVYTSAIYKDRLYLGTNQGLFSKPLNSEQEPVFIPGTQGQVWNLSVVNDALFCGHHRGTFLISGTDVIQIATIPGTWRFSAIEDRPNLVLQGNYDGLYLIEKQAANWSLRNKLEGFQNSARYFEFFKGTIFVNHEYKGLYKLKVNSELTGISEMRIDTLLKGANSGILIHRDDLLYASEKGVFKYEEAAQTFVLDSVLSTIYTSQAYLSGHMQQSQSKDRFWMFTKDNLTLVSPGELTKAPTFKHIPLTSEERNEVVEYENIIGNQIKDQYILGTSTGYITINAANVEQQTFEVYIDKIYADTKGQNSSERPINKSEAGAFSNSQNNISFSFYTPRYTRFLKPRYQFQLEGHYDSWSEFTSDPTVVFENLPPGDYSFKVRSKVGNSLSSNTASYSFSVARPWYLTNLMLAVYVLMILLFSIFMHQVYKRYYRKEQQKLIDKNKRELELARVQNEKEIIKIRNEKLKKDYKLKTKELAASTMSMVKKNELLADIKERLLKAKNGDVKEVIKQIDQNLNHKDNWEFFKEAFDNADRDFFNNLKESHPNLSPNDMKLCAYLRLNLSSKEIAPLFNISARSVEIKRYRLRKKMNLSSNENLTNYILSL